MPANRTKSAYFVKISSQLCRNLKNDYIFTLKLKKMIPIITLFLSVWFSTLSIVLSIALPAKISISFILALLVGLYELAVRLVPTVGNYSLVNKIIDILKWLSEFLNRKK